MDVETLLRACRSHGCECAQLYADWGCSHPYCAICGALVGFLEIYGELNGSYLFRIDERNTLEWSTRCRMSESLLQGSIHYPSLLRCALHRPPNLLACIIIAYAIEGVGFKIANNDVDSRPTTTVFQSEPGAAYQLSGVGRYSHLLGATLKVHFDRDRSSVDLSEKLGMDRSSQIVKARNFLHSCNEDAYPSGYIVHNDCWTLLEWLLGRQAERNLEQLIQILRERFDENPYQIDQYADGGDGTIPSRRWRLPSLMTASNGTPISFFYTRCSRGYRLPRDRLRHNRRLDNLVTKDIVSLRNPLRIAGLAKVIRNSVQNKRRQSMKQRTRRWSLDRHTMSVEKAMKTKSASYKLLHRSFIPEIVYLVLDYLSEPKDINNAIMAFGWKVSDSYWKNRVPRIVLPELDKLCVDIHWKSLFMGYSALLRQPEMRNRQRVMLLIEEVKKRLLAGVE